MNSKRPSGVAPLYNMDESTKYHIVLLLHSIDRGDTWVIPMVESILVDKLGVESKQDMYAKLLQYIMTADDHEIQELNERYSRGNMNPDNPTN